MSVALLVPIQHRPFRGYDDPGLPNGIWLIQSGVLGDGSGGSLTLDIVFKDGSRAVPESSQLYDIEQMTVFSTLDGSHIIDINPSNWDDLTPGSTGTVATAFAAQLTTFDVGSGSALGGEVAMSPTKWFLGQVRKNTTNTIVRFRMTNTAVSLAVKAEGFYWGPESLNAPGGPRRPVDSLYA